MLPNSPLSIENAKGLNAINHLTDLRFFYYSICAKSDSDDGKFRIQIIVHNSSFDNFNKEIFYRRFPITSTKE